MENREFIKNQMTYIGFGDKSILDALDKAIDLGHPRFTLTVSPKNEIDAMNKVKFELNFNKSSQTDWHFFNSFKTSLLDNANNPLRMQLFHVNGTKGITAKESINLLEGRSVKTVLQYNGEDTAVFVKLNFEETNKHGNYKYKSFNQNYGVDVKDILNKAQEYSGLKIDGTKIDKLAKSLEKGNLVKSEFLTNAKETIGYIALEPEFKNLNYFDVNLKKIHHSQLGQAQQNSENIQTNVTISVDNRQNKKIGTEPVVLANISEKQASKLTAFYISDQGSYPSVTPKQLASVPRSVLGKELNNDQRRELFFGNEVKLDANTTLRAQSSGPRELNVIHSRLDGSNEISTIPKSEVSYDTNMRELKPFESNEVNPEKSRSISR